MKRKTNLDGHFSLLMFYDHILYGTYILFIYMHSSYVHIKCIFYNNIRVDNASRLHAKNKSVNNFFLLRCTLCRNRSVLVPTT